MADPSRPRPAVAVLTYKQSYDAAKTAVEHYPQRAIAMQLRHLTANAKTEAQWGAVDALSDLLQRVGRADQ